MQDGNGAASRCSGCGRCGRGSGRAPGRVGWVCLLGHLSWRPVFCGQWLVAAGWGVGVLLATPVPLFFNLMGVRFKSDSAPFASALSHLRAHAVCRSPPLCCAPPAVSTCFGALSTLQLGRCRHAAQSLSKKSSWTPSSRTSHRSCTPALQPVVGAPVDPSLPTPCVSRVCDVPTMGAHGAACGALRRP